MAAELFESYPTGKAWDEMIDSSGAGRDSMRGLHQSFQHSGVGDSGASVDTLARGYLDQGVPFDVGGEERPFPLDIVPRIIDDVTWQHIERGVRQRVRVLEAFLADVYGPCKVVS